MSKFSGDSDWFDPESQKEERDSSDNEIQNTEDT